MATLKELRNVRIDKLKELRQKGIDPYPATSNKDTTCDQITTNFEKLENRSVNVGGRIMSLRGHGKLMFADIKDSSGKVQLYIKEENFSKPNYKYSELGFDDLHLLDVGDFVEGTGKVVKTQSGQISVEVEKIRLLTKSLRPLPDKWEGLKDREVRARRRYLDTTVNEDVFLRFVRRAKFWEAHREFFKKHGFLEINIPVLEHIPGGADAKPFVTHMEAIDQDFYLRISHELYLKRLIGGGYDRVYEIGPRFRNEGLSDEHLPEHMAMEFYWAYADWQQGMQFIEDLFTYVIERVYGDKKIFDIRGFKVDFSKKWERLDFAEIMKKTYGINVHNTTVEEVGALLKKHNIKGDFQNNLERGIDNLWKGIRKNLAGPLFLINHPKYLSPLSKSKVDEPFIVERCQPIIAGSELGNGWSELNDPLDQFDRFKKQQELRDSGDEEAQWLDIDYVEMLEYGMPPTFGWGHSERVFWFLEDVTAREGVPFPQLKHELDPVTVDIYGLDNIQIKPVAPKKIVEKKHDTEVSRELPSREEALNLLEDHVKEPYQVLHAKMVAAGLEAYAEKFGEDKDLWYLTGLLHDVDYFEFPTEHPKKSLEWFEEWNYPTELTHAVAAHAHERTGVEPESRLAAALIAVDELAGLLYAYSLMRPEGFSGMEVSSAKKKFKDKAFAAKVDRDEIMFGVEKLGVDLGEHIEFLIGIFQKQSF
jgi:lysyl-tRNA synthetase class 2